jgi:hypothetical protein
MVTYGLPDSFYESEDEGRPMHAARATMLSPIWEGDSWVEPSDPEPKDLDDPMDLDGPSYYDGSEQLAQVVPPPPVCLPSPPCTDEMTVQGLC